MRNRWTWSDLAPQIRCGCLATLITAATTTVSAQTFPEIAYETNLSSQGISMERFKSGPDSINRFNGALCLEIPLGRDYPVGGRLSYRLRLRYSSRVWRFDEALGVVAAQPKPSNAGLGWNLSFGELLPVSAPSNSTGKWVYVDVHGQVNRFYPTLHPGETPTPNVFFSRRSNYLRLKVVSPSVTTIEYPEGEILQFTEDAGIWRLTERRDVYGNAIFYDYSDPDSWVIRDDHGRVQQILLRDDPAGSPNRIVDKVTLASFGGTVATYDFTYATANVKRPAIDNSPATPAEIQVPVLTSVSRPDGSSYRFEVHTGPDLLPSGLLSSVVSPMGGKIAYQYQTYSFPYVENMVYGADCAGVAQRTIFGFEGQYGTRPTIGTWTFSTELDRLRPSAPDPEQPRILTTRITDPLEHAREHFFSVYVSGGPQLDPRGSQLFERAAYGLPFISALGGLSSEVYDDEANRMRSVYVDYEWDSDAGDFDTNPRERFRKLTYRDDGSKSILTERSDFDQLGHYRTVKTSDSFGDGTPSRLVFTDYHDITPSASDPWVLGIYSTRRITQGTESKETQFCFDSKGTIKRKRVLAGSTPGINDFVKAYVCDARGNLTQILSFGGDTQATDTNPNLCDADLPSTPQFVEFMNYQYGSVSARGWLTESGEVFKEDYAATIDRNTGYPVSTEKGDGFVWTHTYDKMGGVAALSPPMGFGGNQVFTATLATDGTGAILRNHTNEANGTILAEEETFLGPFGRVVRQRRKASSGWSTESTSYDAAGNVVQRRDRSGAVTQLLHHDPFGRPGVVRPPEGTVHDQTYTYTGDRIKTRTCSIGKGWNESTNSIVEHQRTVTTTCDRYQQILEETIQDDDGESRTSTFVHNLAGRILHTTITDGRDTYTKTVDSVVDGRGLLVISENGEAHSGYNALGLPTVLDYGYGQIERVYDRAGRLYEQREKTTSQLLTRNVYKHSSSPGDYSRGKLWKTMRINRDIPHLPNGHVMVTDVFTYGGEGGRASERHTTVTAGHDESHPLHTFKVSQSYNGLGQIVEVHHPERVDTFANGFFESTLPTRTLHLPHELGRLTSVTATGTDLTGNAFQEEWIQEVEYTASGMVTRRTAANGWLEETTPDPTNGNRIQRVRITHPEEGNFYDSGLAEYDGKGKLVKLGAHRKVRESHYSLDVPEPGGDSQGGSSPPGGIVYDIFGKVQQRTYTVPNRFWPSTDVVVEINIYGPGNRRVWARPVNDYDLSSYQTSKDFWYFTDLNGNRILRCQGLSSYDGELGLRFEEAVMEGIRTFGVPVSWIVVEGRTLGTSDNLGGPFGSRLKFSHHGFHGNVHAWSDGSGNITENRGAF